MIQISMSSESADEATKIVNAVVEQYLKQVHDINDKETENSTKRLRELLAELEELSLAIADNDPRWKR